MDIRTLMRCWRTITGTLTARTTCTRMIRLLRLASGIGTPTRMSRQPIRINTFLIVTTGTATTLGESAECRGDAEWRRHNPGPELAAVTSIGHQ